MAGALDSYQTVSVSTADPGALVVQLFDGALRFLRQAKSAAAAGRQAEVAQAVNRAHAILGELSDVLDHEQGGEIAAQLDALYNFSLQHLTKGLLDKNARSIDEVIAIIEPIRDGFDGARQG
jgi:flagellar protein FliS